MPQVDPGIPVRSACFLDVEHAAIARAARHQMLRPLKDEVPPQVREADHIGRGEGCRTHVSHAATHSKKCAASWGPRTSPTHQVIEYWFKASAVHDAYRCVHPRRP